MNKLADNRAADIDVDRIDAKIGDLLREDERSGRGRWARVHVAPNPSSDVDDIPMTRLVILGPGSTYANGGGSSAEDAALDAVARRAGGQRKFRNALVFLAADQKLLDDARRTVRRMLAWENIAADKRLVLVEGQREDARSRASDARKGAVQAIRKAWSHLLSAHPSANDASVLEIERLGVRATGQVSIAEAAWQKAAEGHAVLETLGRATLLGRLRLIWPPHRDDLEIDVLRDWFSEFPHMERLRDEQVLGDAINAAVADISDEGLGFALGKDAQGKYVGLHLHKSVEPRFGTGAMLVRNGIARAQLESDGTGPIALPSKPTGPGVPRPNPPGPQARPKPKRFVGAIELDALRGLAKAGQVFESIINELDRTPGTKFRITLEVTATSDAGFPEDVEDVVKDNAATLGFAEKRFD